MTDDLPDATGDTAAAELALGLLEGDERAAALRRVLAEPGFAAEVERWRLHFATLFDAVPEAEPGNAPLARAEAALDGRPTPARRNWLWPSIASISGIAAALLLAVLLTMPAPQSVPEAPVPPPLVAAVVPTGRGEPVAAIYAPNTGELRLSAATLADARHSAELWVIGTDGVPHSLGLLAGRGATRLAVSAVNRARLTGDAVLAVSVEPVGGSPSGLPTGPVVANGTLAAT